MEIFPLQIHTPVCGGIRRSGGVWRQLQGSYKREQAVAVHHREQSAALHVGQQYDHVPQGSLRTGGSLPRDVAPASHTPHTAKYYRFILVEPVYEQ